MGDLSQQYAYDASLPGYSQAVGYGQPQPGYGAYPAQQPDFGYGQYPAGQQTYVDQYGMGELLAKEYLPHWH